MSANVETTMYVRKAPWHGLGTRVDDAPNSLVAMEKAGLNWDVLPKTIAVAETGAVIQNVVTMSVRVAGKNIINHRQYLVLIIKPKFARIAEHVKRL